MSDFALVWLPEHAAMDLAIEDDDVATDAGLRTAVLISLFSDRRASDEDVLFNPEDRRGWLFDQFAVNEGDRIGSKLWQIARGLASEDIEVQAEAIARESLAWMIADWVASTIDVVVTLAGQALVLAITINRPTGDAIEFEFQSVWAGEDARANAV